MDLFVAAAARLVVQAQVVALPDDLLDLPIWDNVQHPMDGEAAVLKHVLMMVVVSVRVALVLVQAVING